MDDSLELLNAERRRFIESQIAEGKFATPSDALGAAVDLLQQREAALAAFDRMMDEAIASGPAEVFDLDAFLAEMDREFR